MTATITMKVCTGSNAGTETTGTNWNLMSTDAYDATGTSYQTNNIQIPAAGTNYSYERVLRWEFTSTFTEITNVKVWASTLSLPTNCSMFGGETDTGATPTDSDSSIATTSMPTSVGSAFDITPSGGITSSGDKTDYLYVQLDVPSTVTTTGDSSTQTLTVQYDES